MNNVGAFSSGGCLVLAGTVAVAAIATGGALTFDVFDAIASVLLFLGGGLAGLIFRWIYRKVRR